MLLLDRDTIRHFPEGTEEYHTHIEKGTVMVAGVTAEILTGNLPDTRLLAVRRPPQYISFQEGLCLMEFVYK
jgi:hypothetical protein